MEISIHNLNHMTDYLPPFELVSSPHTQKSQHIRPYTWEAQERIRFAVFVDFYRNEYKAVAEGLHSVWSFWRKVSIFVQTKNANQCRIYHKKLEKQYKDPDAIIGSFKSNIRQFNQWKSYYQDALINVKNCVNKQISTLLTEKYHHDMLKTDNTYTSRSQDQSLQEAKLQQQQKWRGKEETKQDDSVQYRQQKSSKISYQHGYRPQRDKEHKQNISQNQPDIPVIQETKQHSYHQNIIAEADNASLAQWTLCHESFMKYVEEISHIFGPMSEELL